MNRLAWAARDLPPARAETGIMPLLSAHQFLWCGNALSVASRALPRKYSVRPQQACFASVRQVDRQNFVRDAAAQLRILQREQHLHSLVKVPLHPVRTPQ